MSTHKQSRPGTTPNGSSVSNLAPADDENCTVRHGANLAVDSANGLFRFLWSQAVATEAAAGTEFSADDLQAKYDLPDLGPATGGVFKAAHEAKIIRRVGYRPSERASRAGGVIAIWSGAVSR